MNIPELFADSMASSSWPKMDRGVIYETALFFACLIGMWTEYIVETWRNYWPRVVAPEGSP